MDQDSNTADGNIPDVEPTSALPPAPPASGLGHPFRFEWSTDTGFGSSGIGDGTGPVPLPPEIGEERMTAWELGDGAGLFDHGFRLRQRVSITGIKLVEPGVLFIRTGLTSTSVCRRDGLETVTEAPGQYSLHLSCRSGDGCTITYSPGEPAAGLAPIITEDRLRSMLSGQKVPRRIERFLNGQGEDFAMTPRASATMQRIARDVRNNPYRGTMSDLFLQAKVFEMLAEALTDLDGTREEAGRLLSPDQRRAMAAREILMADPLAPPSMETLAHRVGLSQRRLVEAFRQIHGVSVTEWLLAWRMDHARDLLLRESLPIKEIAFRLGYSHVNHFISAFTRRFGVPPAKFRKSVVSTHVLGGQSS